MELDLSEQEATGMKILRKSLLNEFKTKHTDAIGWIDNWVSDVEGSVWENPQHIKKKYPSASILPGNVLIFNVKGNSYRLEVKVAYKTGNVFVAWAGTHSDYDKRNKKR